MLSVDSIGRGKFVNVLWFSLLFKTNNNPITLDVAWGDIHFIDREAKNVLKTAGLPPPFPPIFFNLMIVLTNVIHKVLFHLP